MLTVPFLRNLRQAYPEAKIDVLVGPQSGELLTHCPYVDELIYFDTTRKHRYENQTGHPKRSFVSYALELRQRHYDLAFVLKRSFSSALLAWLAGIPQRIGFNTEGRRFLLTKAIPYRADQPEAESFLSVLEAIGIPVRDRHLESWWGVEQETLAQELFQPFAGQHNVLLHLTSSNPAKEWPLGYWVEIARWLIEEKHATLHCLGATADVDRYEVLRQALPQALQGKVQNWCGQTTLLESMAFLKRMDQVIGVDSGTLHMAAAAGTRVVALFGPMAEAKWAPPQSTVVTQPLACRPCNLKTPCHFDLQCMKTLSPEQVKAACETH